MTYGLGIVVFPLSWKLGLIKNTETKKIFSIGPIRFCYHKVNWINTNGR